MKPYLKPLFYDDFSCIAGACRNTCCGNWNINVDSVTAGKYKKINVKLDEKSYLVLDENGMCPNLNDDGLCSLVCKYGEDMLSYTCNFFPRTALENDNYIELYLDNACQAVLDFFMRDKGHLVFTDCEEYKRNISYKKISDECLFTIRDFVIDLLQVEASSIWTRFFAAYRFVKNNADKSLNEIAANINNYYDADFLARTFAEVDGLSLDLNLALQYKAHIFGNVNGTLENGIIYKKYIVPAMEYLGNADIGAMVDGWSEFKTIMEPYEYFFENYMVNSVYKSLIPTSQEEKISDNAEVLLIELSLSYFTCFVWWFLNEKKLTEEEIIDIAGHYARILEHNKPHCSRFLNKLKQDKDLTLGVFYMLLGV